ncbi:hypothetical protein BJ912DRAFT_981402 [Pholiota molesta]|nr:hypothetical protein BJ912DRAFT_981402 [Pholiota molesta]
MGPQKILELVKHEGCQGFLAERLTDEELVNDINKLDITTNMRSYHYSLSYPFYLDLVQPKQILTYVTRAKLVHLLFPQNIFAVRAGSFKVYPLTGSIKVQFELSQLPEHKELGSTLVVRVLDVVEPITVDPLYHGNTLPPIPDVGTLLHRNGHQKNKHDQPMADDLLELMKTSRA